MAELPKWIHDKSWMVYRVIKRDNVIGENPDDGTTVSSQLKFTFANLFEALFYGYSDTAIYSIKDASYNGHDPIATTIIRVVSNL